ncbi:hypothetical protein D3C87_1781960 [compost metagenome]
MAGAVGAVFDWLVIGAEAAGIFRVRKDLIDGGQHIFRGTEGQRQADAVKCLLHRIDTPFGLVALLRKPLRSCALERIDRLLFITDGKKRAPPHAGALAAEEVRRQRLDDRPLHRAGILRLIDENMVDTLI